MENVNTKTLEFAILTEKVNAVAEKAQEICKLTDNGKIDKTLSKKMMEVRKELVDITTLALGFPVIGDETVVACTNLICQIDAIISTIQLQSLMLGDL